MMSQRQLHRKGDIAVLTKQTENQECVNKVILVVSNKMDWLVRQLLFQGIQRKDEQVNLKNGKNLKV